VLRHSICRVSLCQSSDLWQRLLPSSWHMHSFRTLFALFPKHLRTVQRQLRYLFLSLALRLLELALSRVLFCQFPVSFVMWLYSLFHRTPVELIKCKMQVQLMNVHPTLPALPFQARLSQRSTSTLLSPPLPVTPAILGDSRCTLWLAAMSLSRLLDFQG
jgi:hypothetical protein